LWANSSLLEVGQGYVGRVVAEVWLDGSCWLTATDPGLFGPALGALQGFPVVHNPELTLLGDPTTQRPGSEFLGRVVIEFVSRQAPVVATIGQDGTLMTDHARRTLQQLAAAG
jgi:hypothetical protein